jgi:hypothetical protein
VDSTATKILYARVPPRTIAIEIGALADNHVPLQLQAHHLLLVTTVATDGIYLLTQLPSTQTLV